MLQTHSHHISINADYTSYTRDYLIWQLQLSINKVFLLHFMFYMAEPSFTSGIGQSPFPMQDVVNIKLIIQPQ